MAETNQIKNIVTKSIETIQPQCNSCENQDMIDYYTNLTCQGDKCRINAYHVMIS